MPSPYLKSVKMNPAANPHVDGFVNKYDPSAELTKAAGELAIALTNGYVKAKRREDRFTAQRLISDYEEELNSFVKNNALDESYFDKTKDGKIKFDNEFQKHKAEKRKELIEQCPSFERDNAEKLLNGIDLKVGNDLEYLKIKKSNERTVANLNHIIETKTAAYAGMSAAEQKENDRRVEKTLNDAFEANVITADAKKRALEAYNYNKQKAQANHDILAQPAIAEEKLKNNDYKLNNNDLDALRSKFMQVMNHNNLKARQLEQSRQEADVLAVLQLIGEGRSIDTAIDAIDDPDIVDGLRKKQTASTMGLKDVPNNEKLYFSLSSMMETDPEQFKNLNLYKYIGEFDSLAFRILKDRQDSLVLKDMEAAEKAKRKEERAAKEAKKKEFEVKDSYLNPHNDLERYAYASLGILKDSDNIDVAKKRLDFDMRYAEIAQREMLKNGGQLTRAEEKAIVDDLIKELSLRRSYWFDSKTNAGTMTDKEQAYIPYDQLEKKEIEGIIENIKKDAEFAYDKLSESTQKKLVEEYAALSKMPKSLANLRKANMKSRLSKEIAKGNKVKGWKKIIFLKTAMTNRDRRNRRRIL